MRVVMIYTLRAAHAPHLGFQAFARVPKYESAFGGCALAGA